MSEARREPPPGCARREHPFWGAVRELSRGVALGQAWVRGRFDLGRGQENRKSRAGIWKMRQGRHLPQVYHLRGHQKLQ